MKIIKTKLKIGVCLGKNLIILWEKADSNSLKHEIGHSIQAKKFGILYLPVVGVPSLFFYLLTIFKLLDPKKYYSRWPENEADKLGGVERR